ncbi:hypothetical protein DPMN_015081 [Dreissena polymorpha]|uniref:Uncharacterized protein n=1 Tax=Dreissena polymorpha TaxID=45954 RepID=A0A9D4N8I2_DREPO|nr:hypothetical protein DPMN_015081 [Dreissena polymorpha]
MLTASYSMNSCIAGIAGDYHDLRSARLCHKQIRWVIARLRLAIARRWRDGRARWWRHGRVAVGWM